MIDVEDLVFEYPHGRVLDGVSFVVPTGAVLGLTGLAGAGKSTLLRCLASLEAPERGRISVAGVDPQHDPGGLRRGLGYVADRYGLYDAMTADQALTYAARARGVAEADTSAAVARTFADVGLEPDPRARVGTLRPAERERLALGQALVHRPRVLLLDSPEAPQRETRPPQVWAWGARLIARLAAEGVTIALAAETAAELPPVCTHVLELEDGHVVGDGVRRLTRGGLAADPSLKSPHDDTGATPFRCARG